MTSNLAIKQDFDHIDRLMALRFEAFEKCLSLRLQVMEYRLILKVGVMMTIQFGVAITLYVLLG